MDKDLRKGSRGLLQNSLWVPTGTSDDNFKRVGIPNNIALSLKRYIPKTRIEICYHKVKIFGEVMVEIFVLYS